MKSGSNTTESKQTPANSLSSTLMSYVLWPVHSVGGFFSTPVNPSAEKALKEINEYLDSFSKRVAPDLASLKEWDRIDTYVEMSNTGIRIADDFYATLLNIQKSILQADRWNNHDSERMIKCIQGYVTLSTAYCDFPNQKYGPEYLAMLNAFHKDESLTKKLSEEIIRLLELNTFFFTRRIKKSGWIMDYSPEETRRRNADTRIDIIKCELERYMDLIGHLKNYYVQYCDILSKDKSIIASLPSHSTPAESKTDLVDSAKPVTDTVSDAKNQKPEQDSVRRNSLR